MLLTILDIPTMSTIKYFEGKNDHLKEIICVVDEEIFLKTHMYDS